MFQPEADMAGLDRLAHIAAIFSEPAVFHRLFEYATNNWQPYDGCQYATISGTPIAESVFGRPLPSDIEVELVKVMGEFSPHIHQNSDVVAVARGVFRDEAEAWFTLDEDWESLHEGQVIVIPRGTPHGFRIDPTSKEHYCLITVSNPPLADDDTHEYK